MRVDYKSIWRIHVLERIKSAKNLDDICSIVQEYDSSKFNGEEEHCFLERLKELRLSSKDCDRIFDLIAEDGGRLVAAVQKFGTETFKQSYS